MEPTEEPQDRDKLRETHQLAETTYRNIEEFMDDMKSMVTAAKVYQQSLQSVSAASEKFYGLMESVGAKSSNLPGAVRRIGSCMRDMVASHQHMSENFDDWIQSLNTDFIVPMEMKLKEEKKTLMREHRRYRLTSRLRIKKMKKSRKLYTKAMKRKTKSRSDTEKQLQLKHQLSEHTEMVRSTCVEGLRKALIEERKLHCFCVDHYCSVLQNQINYNSTSHRVLSTRVNDWSAQCSSPDDLPTESAALLTDPRSARAFPSFAFPEEDDEDPTPGGTLLADVLQMNSARSPKQRRMSVRVKAMYNHQNTAGEQQLEFNPGDLIDAIDEPQDGWQYGHNTRTGNSGWFPAQYVHRIWPSPNPSRRRADSQPPGPSPLQMGTSVTEREYLQNHQGSGSRRSSQTSSIAHSFR